MLVRKPVLCGAAYGVGIFAFMNLVVIPLSRIGPRPAPAFVVLSTGLLVHMFLIGVPDRPREPPGQRCLSHFTSARQPRPMLLRFWPFTGPFVEETAVSFELVAPTGGGLCGPHREVAGGLGVARRGAGRPMHRLRLRIFPSGASRLSLVGRGIGLRAPSQHRQGIGRALYLRLFEILAQKGFCNAYAGITLPNEGSVGLHRSVGFEPIGIFKAVGWKFGQWQDVAWFHRVLRDSPPVE